MVVRELVTKLGFKVDNQKLNEAESRVSKFGSKAKFAVAGIVAGVGALGMQALSAAADMESMTTQFEVMLGNSEKAVQMMEELKKFSAETPFALEDLAVGAQNLLSFGVAQEDVISAMRMLGDTAGGNAEKLKGLVLAYGKVTVKGKASMEELNMMAERGLPIFEILSTQLGVSKEEMFKMVSKGQVSAANIQAAFQTMTSEGGMFFEGMKKQSMTLNGLISTMKDNLKLVMIEVGTALMPVFKALVNLVTTLAQGPLKDLIKTIAMALIPVISAITGLLDPLIQILIPIMQSLEPIFKAFADVFLLVSKVLEKTLPLFSLLGQLLSSILQAFGAFITTFVDIILMLLDFLDPLIQIILFLIEALLKPFIDAFKGLADIFKIVKQSLTILMEAFRPVLNAVTSLVKVLMGVFAPVLELVFKALNPLFLLIKALVPLFNMLVPVLEFVAKIITYLLIPVEHLINALKWIIESMVELFEKIGKFLGFTDKEDLKSSAEKLASETIKNITNKSNVFNINAPVSVASGSGKAVRDAVVSQFSIELQKIVIEAGGV